MSTSPARLAANAANAQRSTGPRTAEGQARSSQNARTHGLTARDLIVAPNEREEFEELLNDYQTEIKPEGAVPQTLFDELVGAAWNLRRVRRMETALHPDTPSYQDLMKDEEIQKKLDRLARHKTGIERTFHRAIVIPNRGARPSVGPRPEWPQHQWHCSSERRKPQNPHQRRGADSRRRRALV